MSAILEWSEIVSPGPYVPGFPIAWFPRIRHRFALGVGMLGRYPVYSEVSAQRIREVQLKQQIQWRLDHPMPAHPWP